MQGKINDAVQKKLFVRFKNPEITIADVGLIDKVYFAFLCHGRLAGAGSLSRRDRERETYAKLFILVFKYANVRLEEFQDRVDSILQSFDVEWDLFLNHAAKEGTNKQFVKNVTNRLTGENITVFSTSRWLKSRNFEQDVKAYYQTGLS